MPSISLVLQGISKLGLVAALVLSIGLHWACLQSAAWVGMLVTYTAKSGSVSQAVADTFDGRHPCKLCHLVSDGQNQDQKKQQQDGKLKKLDLACNESPRFISPSIPRQNPMGNLFGNLMWPHAPTHGPPRSADVAA
ncbi:MAG: hypothetical protein KDK97_04235 [Verrucomicrobiales bacterium]|nr:hypothetical protein [Verrucomicrobiales bacterium]MCP5559120.1 hypothetical protein [Verrucomicrobiaceae bacterium]